MWERYRHLEQWLVETGRPATAEVLVAERAMSFSRSGVRAANAEDITELWNALLRVAPEGEPPFEIELRKWRVKMLVILTPRDVLEVLYDPKDPRRMVINPSTVPKTADEAAAREVVKEAATRGITGLDPSAGAQAVRAAEREAIAAQNNAAVAEALKARKAAMPDIPAQLEKVHQLFLAGKLNEQEYEKAKKGLLDRL